MKTTARKAVFAVSDHAQSKLIRDPAVSETGVVFDVDERGVDIAELLADALDEGAYIGAVTFRPVPGYEVLAMDQIINLTVADIVPGFLGEQSQDLELRQGQIDASVAPNRPVCVEAQAEPAQLQ